MVPKMTITTAGPGVLAGKKGVITAISDSNVRIGEKDFAIDTQKEKIESNTIFPTKSTWQEVIVKENQTVKKKELIAKGVTSINFDANMWVYLVLVILIGISWGIGKAAVYKHIPEYFPTEVGVVGGMVGLIGGLGGFFGPIIFSYLLQFTGLWSSSWIFIFIFSSICLIWMHITITRMMNEKQPTLSREIDKKN